MKKALLQLTFEVEIDPEKYPENLRHDVEAMVKYDLDVEWPGEDIGAESVEAYLQSADNITFNQVMEIG